MFCPASSVLQGDSLSTRHQLDVTRVTGARCLAVELFLLPDDPRDPACASVNFNKQLTNFPFLSYYIKHIGIQHGVCDDAHKFTIDIDIV